MSALPTLIPQSSTHPDMVSGNIDGGFVTAQWTHPFLVNGEPELSPVPIMTVNIEQYLDVFLVLLPLDL